MSDKKRIKNLEREVEWLKKQLVTINEYRQRDRNAVEKEVRKLDKVLKVMLEIME